MPNEYDSPVEAAEAALTIAKQWKADEPCDVINVAHGFTGGYTMPFEGDTAEHILAWARETYDNLDKCGHCGEIMPDGATKWASVHWIGEDAFPNEEYDYCSEQCAERASTWEDDDQD